MLINIFVYHRSIRKHKKKTKDKMTINPFTYYKSITKKQKQKINDCKSLYLS